MATVAIIKVLKKFDDNLQLLQSQLNNLSDRVSCIEKMGNRFSFSSSSYSQPATNQPTITEIPDSSDPNPSKRGLETPIQFENYGDDNSDPIEILSDSEQVNGSQTEESKPAEKKPRLANPSLVWSDQAFIPQVQSFLEDGWNESNRTKPRKLKYSNAIDKIMLSAKQMEGCPLKSKPELCQWLEKNMPCISTSTSKKKGRNTKFLVYFPKVDKIIPPK
jgi:hypothetical protein